MSASTLNPTPVESPGHVMFALGQEWFYGPDGDLYRAPASATVDSRTGYRLGARFESRPGSTAEWFIEQARAREAAR